MKKKTLLCAAFATLLAQPFQAQKAVVDKIIEIGRQDNQAVHQLDILTNRFGGRPIGSDAYENAAEWMVREYKKWGLEVHLEEAGELPVGFNRGPWSGKLLSHDHGMTLHFATPSYTSGTKGVQRGHVLAEPHTEQEFERMRLKLKGAWVLIFGTNNGWPIDRSAQGDSIRQVVKKENEEIDKKNAELRRRNWANGEKNEMIPYREFPALFYHEMVEAGALGFIQSSEVPIRALYDRKMIDSLTFDNLPEVPDIKLDSQQFDVIAQMVKERREDFLLEFDIRNHFKLGPVKYHNVVASIRGSKYPDEQVIVCGHLDSFDVGTGGVDCGTGIAPMMEAARMLALSGAKPKRTIRFIAFAGEEFGLLGSKAYCKKHQQELPKVQNVFNRDGGPEPPVGIAVSQAMYDDFVKITEPLKKIRADIPFEVTVREPRKRPKVAGGTDSEVFATYGVPTYGFTTKDVKGYNFSYGEIWHTERDLFTKNIPEYLEHTATVTAVTALGVANLDKPLSREGVYEEE